jgi:hypothetical protein
MLWTSVSRLLARKMTTLPRSTLMTKVPPETFQIFLLHSSSGCAASTFLTRLPRILRTQPSASPVHCPVVPLTTKSAYYSEWAPDICNLIETKKKWIELILRSPGLLFHLHVVWWVATNTSEKHRSTASIFVVEYKLSMLTWNASLCFSSFKLSWPRRTHYEMSQP